MIGKGGVAEVYRGIFCDGPNEIEVAVKLFSYSTTSIRFEKLEDLLKDPKNEMDVFEAFYNQNHSDQSGIIKMFDGGEIQNIVYADKDTRVGFKYLIITELGGDNFFKYIEDEIYVRKGLSESEIMTELEQPATCLIQIHKVAIHMDFKPENLVFDSKNNLKAIDFGGSILLPKGKSRSDGIRVKRKTTSLYIMPPEINTVLKSELNTHFKSKDSATYTKEYATTKTDIWEFGILIFQIILLNDNQLSVSALAKINNFFNYLFLRNIRLWIIWITSIKL
uniref:Protein kinase domain-containing protein n=1 Tax=Meloidogyne enterolobii TaxID=390850 RepID=A0A6V7VVR1_MELEN|nr:unnamed protein product [Meloidogyne enterolobii]